MTIELPELPEGFFWRVGEVTTYVGYTLREVKVPAVILMERVTKFNKPEVSFGVIVDGSHGKWDVERQHIKFSSPFYAPTKEDIPDFAVSSKYVDYAKAYYYYVGLDPEGIRHKAEAVLKLYNNTQEEKRKYEEEKRKEQEAKDRFYGDYPPKTLEGK